MTDLRNLINPKHVDKAQVLNRTYDSADPFRHVVMDDFFRPEVCDRLLENFPLFDEKLALNEDGYVGRKCVHEQLGQLGEPYPDIDRLIQTNEFLGWLGRVTSIDGLLYDPDYVGGGTHENRHGQWLDTHVDFNKHPRTGLHRRLNLIVYLNREWEDEWGGSIEFHSDPYSPKTDRIVRVEPTFNRAVLFETTHWSWHGFSRISLPDGDDDKRSRKSLALYFYSEERPVEEITKPHSTIYVQDPLPERFHGGYTLTDEDSLLLEQAVASRDQHLKRLYGFIADRNEHIDDLIRQRDQALEMLEQERGNRAMNPIIRKARSAARRVRDLVRR